jgi:two-component system LytT family response regulator
MLSRHEDMEVVGECGSVGEIFAAIVDLAPDVVFLDVRMPGGTGIDALRSVQVRAAPLVVLVTAFEEHALEAFDIAAVDYLLKPFSDEAFERSVRRVRQQLDRIRAQEATRQIAPAVGTQSRGRTARPSDRVAVRSGERIRFIETRSIRWIAAEGDYARIHTPDGEHLLRETMGALQKRLGTGPFVRIHRSTLVRADFIREVRARDGRYAAVFRDGTRRNISRRGRERLREALGVDL